MFNAAEQLFQILGPNIESAGLHDAAADFVQMLDDNTVHINQAPIGDYGYNELDGGHGEEDDVEEVDEGVYDEAQAKHARSTNYTHWMIKS